MLLNGLALVIAGLPAPSPPTCPWAIGEEVVLMPGMVPLNASVWIRSYSSENRFDIIGGPTGSVPFDQIDIDLTSTPGRLIELRPRELLRPDTQYSLHSSSAFGAGGTFVTTSTTDEVAPPSPGMAATRPFTSIFDLCTTAGFFVDVPAQTDPVIYLLEDPEDGSIHEIGTSFETLARTGFIIGGPNEPIRFRVVAMDLAGNRSTPSPETEGITSATQLPPRVGMRVPPPDEGPFGCSAAGGSASWLALVLLVGLRRRS